MAGHAASLLLGALSKLVLDAWTACQNRKATTDFAVSRANLGQATIVAHPAELQAQADAPKTADAQLVTMGGVAWMFNVGMRFLGGGWKLSGH